MIIRPSSALRNAYPEISTLAKETGEPIFITNKGEEDGVFMSMAAWEEREKMLANRAAILEAEEARLRGDRGTGKDALDAEMEEKLREWEK